VTDFNEMTELDFIEGRFVEGTVHDLLDEFAYEEEYQQTLGIKHSERVSKHYYILPLEATYDSDVPQYAALCIGNTALAEKAGQMIDEYWEYLVTGEEPAVWTEFHITGKISKLDGELMGYFYDWFYEVDDEMTREDIEPMICPYMITYQVAGASSTTMTMSIVILAIGIVGCVGMVLWYKRQEGRSADLDGRGTGFSDSFPTQPSQSGNNLGGYNSVNGTSRKTDNAEAGSAYQSTPAQAPGEYRDMDSIDTSGLGIGIGDDDK
ncbi:MAG: hypothetical protein K2K57_00655, partial [Oscillospiraceae bacterium]|nr:hypothetical protein [Oscillospiraceae bacterium]